MEVSIKPGMYVLAVSGGVDSAVLLDILSKQPGVDLVVAHFNHGIRPDSREDERLVASLAKHYDLPIEIGSAELGPGASESAAREARYAFLRSVQKKHRAKAIITAHHQDDLIETAMINILRGTGPRGLVSLAGNPEVIRPLLSSTKKEIYQYAKIHNLAWREDYTNADEEYLRNYLRKQVTPKITQKQKELVLKNIDKVAENIKDQNKLIATLSQKTIDGNTIDRSRFSLLPSEVATELITFWLRKRGLRDFDNRLITHVNELLRTGLAGSRHDLNKKFGLVLTKTEAKLTTKV